MTHPALTIEMVNAANALYEQYFDEWKLCDSALNKLKIKLPEWDESTCLAKAAAVNQLYGTNVYKLVPLAQNIADVMQEQPVYDASLVTRISTYPGNNKRHISFASKFCHFFLCRETFPILDEVACDTLKLFLGNRYLRNGPRYESFLNNIETLRSELKVSVDNEALDRFLWLHGLLNKFKRDGEKAKINSEAKRVFGSAHQDTLRLLAPC